ncbi:MAG TPA: thioesterase domain-containing protein, partial [Deltaproteobacteria bacterium]|nr:thioesterase domain-containing protein [Deltaproteobacteria bacterium]
EALERELGDAVYLLFGYSLGGLLAFELAREMRRRGLPLPRHLFVAAVSAPQIKPREKPFSDLPHDAFLTKIRELGGTPEELLANPEILELLMPVLRSDFKAYETYTFQEGQPLTCPITALGGTRDKLVEREDLNGWSVHAGAGFGLHLFEGDHFFINMHFKDVCTIINRALSPQRPW